jgi:glutathione S-transferase
MRSEKSSCVLITIPISHYCEKARWALDRAGVSFSERAHVQGIHRLAARRAGGGTTVPVLVCGATVLVDSAAIVDYADAHAPADRRLYPADAALAAEARALEREFDARLGPHGRRWMYSQMRQQRALALAYAVTGVPAWERHALRAAFPLIVRLIEHRLAITPATAAASLNEVRAVFDAVGARLADGRQHLVGDRFTAADLTFAALAAAVLVPPQYAVPLPQPDELPARMAAVVRELRAHPAGAHALAMFRRERR